MSDAHAAETPQDPQPQDATPLADDALESVSGGVIDGGCIPTFPWDPTGPIKPGPFYPTFPTDPFR